MPSLPQHLVCTRSRNKNCEIRNLELLCNLPIAGTITIGCKLQTLTKLMPATVYLIPTVLSEGETGCLPSYILDAVKDCSVFFVENERTARRFLKLLWKEIVIDDYEWYNIKEVNDEVASSFGQKIKEEKILDESAVLSENESK